MSLLSDWVLNQKLLGMKGTSWLLHPSKFVSALYSRCGSEKIGLGNFITRVLSSIKNLFLLTNAINAMGCLKDETVMCHLI